MSTGPRGIVSGIVPVRSNYWKSLWRRRESNPGPQSVQPTFLHVRSRLDPVGRVRGFGRDLSLPDLDLAIEGALARSSPVVDARGIPGRSLPWTALRFLRLRE